MSGTNSILSPDMRNKIIVRTGIFGIIANFFLAGFKVAVGLFSNSIAVILDAVNNTADAFSSLITIIGAKCAAKKPDKKHPLGYGRIEYLSAMIVAAIIYTFTGFSLEAYLGVIIGCFIVKSFVWALQMHGFFIDFKDKSMRFDVVCSFKITSDEAVKLIKDKLHEKYPDYKIHVSPDVDISDL